MEIEVYNTTLDDVNAILEVIIDPTMFDIIDCGNGVVQIHTEDLAFPGEHPTSHYVKNLLMRNSIDYAVVS